MNKRDLLKGFLGLARYPDDVPSSPAFKVNNSKNKKRVAITAGLEPYSGAWDEKHARHLLRRLTFGASKANLDQVLGLSIDKALELLLTEQKIPLPPVIPSTGATWTDKAYDSTNDPQYRLYLKDWWIGLMATQSPSIHEKMVLFWHNHFVSEMNTVGDSRYMYKQNDTIRQNALGNIKTLVKLITKDPAMLRYLNGNTNIAGKPNENYGRELQELFTIGKGPEILPGNYTNYSEQDVQAAAKVLTGWKDNTTDVTTSFDATKHDTTDKQFSADYQNTIIKGVSGASGGDSELDSLVNMIFNEQETAKSFCRILYRWFIYYLIDSVTEQNVIVPLANIMRSNNFEIKPVLLALFRSAHFFDDGNIGCLIKNPMDFILGAARELNLNLPDPNSQTVNYYTLMDRFRAYSATLQMDIMDPPNVAGWPAYYQEPDYHELWINTATLPYRNSITDTLITGITISGTKYFIDSVQLANTVSNPGDVNILINELCQKIFSNILTTNQINYLIYNVLIPGLPDYEWSVEWNNYTGDSNNATKKKIISDRLNSLIKFMLRMAEYQLC